jgi:hypothetical protein
MYTRSLQQMLTTERPLWGIKEWKQQSIFAFAESENGEQRARNALSRFDEVGEA